MNEYKHVIKKFSFLTEHGYRVSEYLDNGIEVIFSNCENKICIMVYTGINCCLEKVDCVDVIIDVNGNRRNINDCTCIDNDKLWHLERQLLDKDACGKIDVYAKFIEENFAILI